VERFPQHRKVVVARTKAVLRYTKLGTKLRLWRGQGKHSACGRHGHDVSVVNWLWGIGFIQKDFGAVVAELTSAF
jgi:hypothetical protein